jgi:Kef-type K+ transport system membrane component KefB
MTSFLQLILTLTIIVAVAKAAGYLSIRLGQPAVLGELLAGLLLGPTVLNMLGWPFFSDAHLGDSIKHLAEIGVLFLMFVAGLEVDLEGMLRSGRVAALSGVLGVVAPAILGWVAALLFGFGTEAGLFIGLMLTPTSVSISAQTLMELGVLRSLEGVTLLGAAVVDDILAILLLSVFIALTGGGGGGAASILWVVGKMSLYLALALVAGIWLIPRLTRWVEQLPISEGVMALVVVMALFYGWAAEVLGGMAAITGTFLAGLFFARTPLHEYISRGMHTLTYAWLVPVFFVSIGLEANARAMGVGDSLFMLVLILVAVLSKVLGSGVGARLAGFDNRQALRLGVGMVSRGEVGLIVASLGLEAGLISEGVFASVVIMVLATTLLTPLMLRVLYPGVTPPGKTASASSS